MLDLEVRLFGPPRVYLGGREVRFDTRKAMAILAILAVTEREYSREALAAMLWPELDRSHARATLRRTLSVAGAVGQSLDSSAAGVSLAPVTCDVVEFRRLASSTDPLLLAAAVDLAADRFLDGFSLRDSPMFEDWQIATGDALRDQLSQTLGRLVSHSTSTGNLDAALTYARRRTAVDPLSEPAHVELIRLTALTGDRPAALQAYRALVRMLDRELGVPPLPGTMQLHDQIRAGSLEPPHPDLRSVVVPAAVPTLLVGRDLELAEFRSSLEQGVSVGLVGEPGVGRSALSRVLAAEVESAGSSVLRLSGQAAEMAIAYGAASDLVRAMLVLHPGLVSQLGITGEPLGILAAEFAPVSAAGIRGPGDLQRLHEAVRAAATIVAAKRSLVLVIDDVHLLDLPSAALIAYLVRRLPAGLAVVATWSAGSGGLPLREAIHESGRVRVLAPLDHTAVATLLEGTGLDVAEVLRRTRGVPLLVREFAVGGESGGEHGTARDLVAARLEAASEATRQVVGAVVIIGTVADPELLRVASGRDEAETVDAIEEAIARGLLVERVDRPGYDVPHELVREAALARLSLARARLLHGRVADLLVRRHGLDPLVTPAGAVARHLAAAGRDEEAGAWFLASAEESTRLAAHTEALTQLRAALALGHHPLDVHQAIGLTLVRLGHYGDALVALDQAAALAEADPVRQAAIEHTIAGVYDRQGDWPLAEAHLESAGELVADGPPARRARILADLALVQHRQGKAAKARETASRAAAEAGDPAATAQAANVLGMLAVAVGAHKEARSHLGAAVAVSRRLRDSDLLIAALNNLSRAEFGAGNDDAALAAAREALELAERQGDRHRLAALHSHLADLLHASGREDEAREALTLSAASFAQVHGAGARPEVWTLTEW